MSKLPEEDLRRVKRQTADSRTSSITIRVSQGTRSVLEDLARLEDVSVSSLAFRLLTDALAARMLELHRGDSTGPAADDGSPEAS